MNKIRVFIDAGHGNHTAGKRCLKSIDPNETREWYLNQRIASMVCERLEKEPNIETLRGDDTSGALDISLSTRTAKANTWGANYLVSIHHNAGINGGTGGGVVVFVYNGERSKESDILQENVYKSFVESVGKFGNRSEPMAEKNLHMVREAKCPSILIECGFMDSQTDTPMILTEDFAVKAAEGISNGILNTIKEIKGAGEEEMKKEDIEKLIDERFAYLLNISGTGDNPSEWARESTEWAKDEGIFVGDEKGNFGWQKPPTREQIAVILKKIK